MSLLGAFTTQMVNLSNEIKALYPNDTDLRLGHNIILLLKNTNPRKLHTVYYKYVLDYKDQIKNKDESFFINHDFNDLAEKNKHQDKTFNLVDKIKNYWNELSIENKETTWIYFQVLTKLSEKINTEKIELMS